MRLQRLATMLVLGLTLIPALAKDKNQVRDWKTGKLVAVEEGTREHVPVGVSPPVPGYSGPRNVYSATYYSWVYTVETETMIYGFCERRHKHPRPLTIGNQVKFAFGSKENAFLIDESGKEFKVEVVRQAAKQAVH